MHSTVYMFGHISVASVPGNIGQHAMCRETIYLENV